MTNLKRWSHPNATPPPWAGCVRRRQRSKQNHPPLRRTIRLVRSRCPPTPPHPCRIVWRKPSLIKPHLHRQTQPAYAREPPWGGWSSISRSLHRNGADQGTANGPLSLTGPPPPKRSVLGRPKTLPGLANLNRLPPRSEIREENLPLPV